MLILTSRAAVFGEMIHDRCNLHLESCCYGLSTLCFTNLQCSNFYCYILSFFLPLIAVLARHFCQLSTQTIIVQPKNNARTRTSFCVRKKSTSCGFCRLFALGSLKPQELLFWHMCPTRTVTYWLFCCFHTEWLIKVVVFDIIFL